LLQRTRLPCAQQSAVKQDGGGIGRRNHAAWYAEHEGPGNRA
jgi:hypothetical protein